MIDPDKITVELVDNRFGIARYFTNGFFVGRDAIDPGWFVFGRSSDASANVVKRVAWPAGPRVKWPKRSRLVQPGFRTKAEAQEIAQWVESRALGPMTIEGDGTVKQNPTMQKWDLFWSPTGQKIATVEATTESAARRKAPPPYRKYLGEIYAVAANPLTRIKRKEIGSKPSQATGSEPDERLVKRRKRTAATPIPGVYANPLTRVEVMSNSQRYRISEKTGKPTKRPSKRLIQRRTITESLPKGYYANPVDPEQLYDSTSYGTKATRAALVKRAETLAQVIGAPSGYVTGAIAIEKNFNGYRLIQVTDGKRGLDRNLSGILSAGELLNFIDGAILVARAAK